MRTLSLTISNLKRFVRNWRSILLLTVFPLVVVGLIFLSFSPNEVKTSVGIIDDSENISRSEIEKEVSDFMEMSEYRNVEDCREELQAYELHACISLKDSEESDQVEIETLYDNTRTVIDSTVRSTIEGAADKLEVTYSEKRASRALTEVGRLTREIAKIRSELDEINSELDRESELIDEKISSLEQNRDQMKSDLNQMDQDAKEVENDLEKAENRRNKTYTEVKKRINAAQKNIQRIENRTGNSKGEIVELQDNIDELNQSVEKLNSDTENTLGNAENLLESYKEFRNNSKGYLREINRTIEQLEETKKRIADHRRKLDETDEQLESLQTKYSTIGEKDPEQISSFIKNERNQEYSPSNIGANLLILQTYYSTLLLLVALFVSILISKFITLNEINTQASQRIRVNPKMFLPEYISLYFTSMMLVLFPIACILLFGEYFFQLPLSQSKGFLLFIFLFCSTLVNLGIGSAYLIERKTITLLVGSFLIVFLIFFSGFIIPTEMMSELPRNIAEYTPGKITQESFAVTVLHAQELAKVYRELSIMGAWNILFMGAALLIKARHENRKLIGS